VQVNYEVKTHFIHRTFAEYYVANFVLNQMTKETNLAPQVQHFLLKDVLLKEDHQVIRVFINGLLSKTEPSIILKQYGNLIDELWKDGVLIQKREKTILRRAAHEGNAYISGFLLDTLKVGKRTETLKTILHLAAQEGNAYIIGFLLDTLKEGKHTETLKELLLAHSKDGRTAWHFAVMRGNKEVWQKLWYWGKETLTLQALNNNLLVATDEVEETV
jgi:hypothetical protein